VLQQTIAQLRSLLEAEKRAAAGNQRRMVAENAQLVKQLKEGGLGVARQEVLPTSPGRSTACSRAASRVAGFPICKPSS
jgi:hypothetical protein